MRPFLADHFLAMHDAGTIDQPVEATESGSSRIFDGRPRGSLVGDIGLREARLAAQFAPEPHPSIQISFPARPARHAR